MASPQLENGYTKIADELLNAIGRCQLSSYEYRVLLVIIRKTYGWNKKKDWISLSQFVEATNIKDSHICRAVNLLIKQNIIIKSGTRNKPQYSIQKDYDKWFELPKGVRSHHKLLPKGVIQVTKGGNSELPKGGDTKDTITKDTITKDIAETSSALKVKNKNMFGYNEDKHYEEKVIDIESGEVITSKPQTKKYPNAKIIFNLFGKYPANWKINKTQLQAAENLFSEKGVEQVVKALSFFKENKDNEFCPVIDSPYDLDSKWSKLIHLKKKLQ